MHADGKKPVGVIPVKLVLGLPVPRQYFFDQVPFFGHFFPFLIVVPGGFYSFPLSVSERMVLTFIQPVLQGLVCRLELEDFTETLEREIRPARLPVKVAQGVPGLHPGGFGRPFAPKGGFFAAISG